ncbi:hypothetical protein LZZ90_12525 [Flavobacterium sp. SM15]|uniref:hypothetical protein n=1 Tax=Flavobacterium sp. SM15 TaxID=2908005 RepID=UPI001EDBD7DD|nr:hypothetical protein [Flavobacterium sp. SM15]MCG2612332.1 hypothetical protein [Flavobacterium sp. SM15]
MKHNLKYAIFCVFFLTIGCIKNSPEVVFENNNHQVVDSVKIYTRRDCKPLTLYNIKPKESKTGNIIFCRNNKSDGSYGIEIFRKGKIITTNGFGYYTNGGSINHSFQIHYGEFGSILVNSK